ncbi:hypothetical protein KM043_014491 [Ampulex compressa]|nr:hypothetical protein KM043_014491 [Ampulex compressa]
MGQTTAFISSELRPMRAAAKLAIARTKGRSPKWRSARSRHVQGRKFDSPGAGQRKAGSRLEDSARKVYGSYVHHTRVHAPSSGYGTFERTEKVAAQLAVGRGRRLYSPTGGQEKLSAGIRLLCLLFPQETSQPPAHPLCLSRPYFLMPSIEGRKASNKVGPPYARLITLLDPPPSSFLLAPSHSPPCLSYCFTHPPPLSALSLSLALPLPLPLLPSLATNVPCTNSSPEFSARDVLAGTFHNALSNHDPRVSGTSRARYPCPPV